MKCYLQTTKYEQRCEDLIQLESLQQHLVNVFRFWDHVKEDTTLSLMARPSRGRLDVTYSSLTRDLGTVLGGESNVHEGSMTMSEV